MPFALFVDSSNSLTLEPEYNFKQGDKKIESEHRMRDGSRFSYKWGDYKRFAFDLTFVNSESKSKLNAWWNNNTELLFMEVGATSVTSVVLTNKELPIGKFMKPYTDLFGGKIELETY